MFSFSLRIKISNQTSSRLKKIIEDFQTNKNYDLTYKQLIAEDIGIRQQWKTDPRFRNHVSFKPTESFF